MAAIVGANGYRVIDLGTSVHSVRVLEAIKEHRPVAVLGSSLMTSTRSAFLETADLLAQEGIDAPLIIDGGAIDGASPARGRICDMPGTRGRRLKCWMRL